VATGSLLLVAHPGPAIRHSKTVLPHGNHVEPVSVNAGQRQCWARQPTASAVDRIQLDVHLEESAEQRRSIGLPGVGHVEGHADIAAALDKVRFGLAG
jgi:hypothetical protein